MHTFPSVKRRRGFTLIELLVVIAIIAILMSLLMAAVSSAYKISQVLTCKNNLKNLGTAIKAYESQSQCLPPMFENRQVPAGATSYTQISFFYQLLPFIEMDVLQNKAYSDAATNTVKLYICPVDAASTPAPNNVTYGNYAANYEVFRGYVDPTQTPAVNFRVTTSTAMPGCSSSCIIMGERLQLCGTNNQGGATATIWSSYGPSSYFHTVYTVKTSGLPVANSQPFGMYIAPGVSSAKCVPYTTANGNPDDPGSPSNQPTQGTTTFQAAHSGVINVLRGDGMVSQIANGFDPKSLNYYCVGIGRDAWTFQGVSYTTFP